jgi:tRNA threonylcarbamoyladenosine biosynthesis protein TsaB
MWHLALETIGLSGSVALFKDTQLVADCLLPAGVGSARSLLPTLHQVVQRASLLPRDLELISLAHGPGSFTGLRVSVATAKTIGYAIGIPVCAVDTLETLAYRLARQPLGDNNSKPRWIAVAMDAYRKQVFRLIARVEFQANQGASPFEFQIDLRSQTMEAALWSQNPLYGLSSNSKATFREILSATAGSADRYAVIVGGNAAQRYPLAADVVSAAQLVDASDISAVDVGHYAWRRWLAGDQVDPFQLLPNYLRASAAEEKASSHKETL